MWSGAARSTPINDKTDRKKPSAWRKGNRKTRRSVNAVSIAQSENFFGAPGRPDGDGCHASVASAESHSVTSPRWTKACSYADQFPTRYFVLYFGWTFDLMSRSCTRSGHRGQRAYSCLVAAEGCRVAPGDCSPEALTRTGLGGFHHPALPLMWLMARSTTFRISGDMSPDVNAPVMGPFESSHQHGPPLLGRVRGPTRSPTSSLVCSPPTPSLPSAAAPVVPGRWPTLSLVRQGGRRASQVPGPSSSSVP